MFGRYTQSDWTNTALGTVTELGDRVFVQDTKNWQVSHRWPIRSNLVNQFRVGLVDARADQHGIPCAQADVDFLNVTGTFTGIPTTSGVPGIGMTGYRARAAR